MKTTVELPDALFDAVKRLAREQRTTMRELIVEGLRRELERRESATRVDVVFRTYGGQGANPEVDPADWIETSYGSRT